MKKHILFLFMINILSYETVFAASKSEIAASSDAASADAASANAETDPVTFDLSRRHMTMSRVVDKDERQAFMRKVIQEYCRLKSEGKHTSHLDYYFQISAGRLRDQTGRIHNYGWNYNWLGPVETRFLDELVENDKEETEVLFLACGTGRVVVDALNDTENLHVTANDLSRLQIETLEREAAHLSLERNLTTRAGDAYALLKQTESNSIHFLHMANFIHYLNEERLSSLMVEAKRVLKPHGTIYCFWNPYSDGRSDMLFNNSISDVGHLSKNLGFTIVLADLYEHQRAQIATVRRGRYLINFNGTLSAQKVPLSDLVEDPKVNHGAVLILRKSPPTEVVTKRCSSCFELPKKGKKLSECGGCHSVFYCNRDCQVRDWKRGHRRACKELDALRAANVSKSGGETAAANPVSATDDNK